MVQPINYGVEIADPTQAFLGAFQAGASIQDARLKQEQQTQQQANQALIQQGFAKLRGPGATTEDAANLAMILPKDQSESVLKAWALKTDAQKQNSLSQSGKVVSALFAGENDIAAQLINDQAVAMRNSGNEEGAKFLETWLGITEINPAATQNFFTAQLLQLPGGKDIVDNIIKLRTSNIAEAAAPAELRKKLADASEAETKARVAFDTATDDVAKAKAQREFEQAKAEKEAVEAKYAERTAVDKLIKSAADLGLTKAQTNSVLAQTRKLGVETSKIALELEALKASGGIDPAKAFDQEEKLRKEFQLRSKVYGELGTTFSNIQSSANAKTGPGDIALITGFMKMLDPGSVVRETEFATARDTAGLYTRLENSLKKAESGQFLQPNQREEFVNLARQYLNSAQKKAGDDKKALGVVVKNYKLNPENVFGPEVTGGGGRGVVNPPVPGQTNVTVDY